MDFQQSKTYQNLLNALAYETQSSSEYNIAGIQAEQENLIGISFTFETLSRNDRFIAERLRNFIHGGEPDTEQNLIEAAEDSLYAGNTMYREFSRIATEEGFNDIASFFNGVANIKLNHNYTINTYLSNLQNDSLFCKDKERLWVCLGCGNILSGTCAPIVCPICGYPQGYYQPLSNNM